MMEIDEEDIKPPINGKNSIGKYENSETNVHNKEKKRNAGTSKGQRNEGNRDRDKKAELASKDEKAANGVPAVTKKEPLSLEELLAKKKQMEEMNNKVQSIYKFVSHLTK
jgi:hypothetical protein